MFQSPRTSFIILAASLLASTAPAGLVEDIEAAAGGVFEVPPGVHEIDRTIMIREDNTVLVGLGTIVQTNPAVDIIRVDQADGVRIEGLTLTRAEGAMDTEEHGILATECSDLVIRNVIVRDNRTGGGSAIRLSDMRDSRVEGCEVINYKRIAVDDRTDSDDWGYAFHCINGHGIIIRDSQGIQVLNNRIVEENLIPDQETRDKFSLGKLTEGKRETRPGILTGTRVIDAGEVQNWHQGSAMIVTGPTKTRHVLVQGNYIENAGQGIDMHADLVVCNGNIIKNAFIGLKMTHGSRNMVMTSNVISNVDLWGILLNPGAGSHAAAPADGDTPAREANVDRGTIVANNIITDIGYGPEWWNWGAKEGVANLNTHAIALFEGQKPENPPLRDVLIVGNLVYNSGSDGVLRDGEIQYDEPRYKYAIFVGRWNEEGDPIGDTTPRDLMIRANLLEPGLAGVSNIDIGPQ